MYSLKRSVLGAFGGVDHGGDNVTDVEAELQETEKGALDQLDLTILVVADKHFEDHHVDSIVVAEHRLLATVLVDQVQLETVLWSASLTLID